MDLQTNKLSQKECNMMRGVAIFFIIFHHLTRLVSECRANEFFFKLNNTNVFFTKLINLDATFWLEVSTFLGWFGLVVFIFLSGYGLVCKYEKNDVELNFKSFVGGHFKKLFSLMIIPYLLYLFLVFVLHDKTEDISNIFYQLTFLGNLVAPSSIYPDIYWFFGLMMQLYICYYFLFYKKRNRLMLYVNILSFIVLFSCFFFDKPEARHFAYHSYAFHNCIGWIFPFTLGILYGRNKISLPQMSYLKNLVLVLVGGISLVILNCNVYTWFLTPVLAIFVALCLNEVIKPIKIINSAFAYLGILSAFIFCAIPHMRQLYLNLNGSKEFLDVLLYYFIPTIILAILYMKFYKELFVSTKANESKTQ